MKEGKCGCGKEGTGECPCMKEGKEGGCPMHEKKKAFHEAMKVSKVDVLNVEDGAILTVTAPDAEKAKVIQEGFAHKLEMLKDAPPAPPEGGCGGGK
jgi:hypothetical protein